MPGRQGLLALTALFLTGCAAYGGRGLKPGESRLEDVLAVMGTPAVQWSEPDGSRKLQYPRGPLGVHTWQIQVDAAGRLAAIENLLDEEHFSQIKPGMSEAQVLRLLGPSYAPGTAFFERRNEWVLEWRYCDAWRFVSRFDVMFDATSRLARSSFSWREQCGDGDCYCAR